MKYYLTCIIIFLNTIFLFAQTKPETLKDFPVVTMNAPNGNVFSYLDAAIVDNPLPKEKQKIFNDNIVYSLSSTYTLYNKESTVKYYVIVFDFIKTVNDINNIKYRDIIGKTNGNDPKLLVFCSTLDPLFVINCDSFPYFYEGFYWFDGSFLLPSSTTNAKWLNFKPTENINKILIDMADHVMESAPSLTIFYNENYRFKTQLKEYPRQLSGDEKQRIANLEKRTFSKTGIITHVNEIRAGKYKYMLCWQSGFDQYLTKEYKLNNDIWIYGRVMTYSIWDNCGYIFIRDFKLETLEEMYEKRLKIIKENTR
jgi:hypothetical protein